MPKVFVTKQRDFCPEICSVIGFPCEWGLAPLLENVSPDDRLVVLGTTSAKREFNDRILGMLAFYPKEVDGEDFVDSDNPYFEDYYQNGKYRWPHAVRIKKAWKLPELPKVEDFINKAELSSHRKSKAELLKNGEALLALFREKGEEVLVDDSAWNKKGTRAKGRSRGLAPTSHSVRYKRNFNGPAYVYVSRFGNSNIWKIGWAKDVANRLKSLNEHVPHEFLKQEWRHYLDEKYDSGKKAFDAEQAMLDLMEAEKFSMWGEQVQCSEEDIKKAWEKLKQMF